MNKYIISLTKEECTELQRTLISRLDLDIRSLQKDAANNHQYEKIANLQHIYDINKSILEKLINLNCKF